MNVILNMDHQDWKPVILRKDKKPEKVTQKVVKPKNTQSAYMKKLENEDVKIQYMDKSISKKIAEARTQLKMTQQDLANKLCVKKYIINDLESGKILKNDKVIRKALNILRIK